MSWDLLVIVLMGLYMWFSANFVLIYMFLNSDPDKHYLMYEHERVPIVVREKDCAHHCFCSQVLLRRAFSPVFVFLYLCIYLLIKLYCWALLHRVEQNISKCKVVNISTEYVSFGCDSLFFVSGNVLFTQVLTGWFLSKF